jgi:multiple sugar transport system substrate-binding protein
MPDVFWMHSNNSQLYMKNDMLLDLTDYIKNSDTVKIDDYMPEVTQLYTYNDHYYAIRRIMTRLLCGTTRRCSMMPDFLSG